MNREENAIFIDIAQLTIGFNREDIPDNKVPPQGGGAGGGVAPGNLISVCNIVVSISHIEVWARIWNPLLQSILSMNLNGSVLIR